MNKFLNALDAGVVDLPPRPLMYTDGQGDGKKTSDPEAPAEVCDWATGPALLQPTEVPQDQLIDAVTQAEEKIQKLVVSNTRLEDRVRELEELLCEARRDDMKSKVSLSKAEESIAQWKVEKANLTNQVKTQQGKVQYMENLLCKAHRWSVDLINVTLAEDEEKHQKAVETIAQFEVEKSEFQMKNEEMKKCLIQTVESLKVSLAEAEENRQKAMETIAQLEVEKSDLKDQVAQLEVELKDMENLLSENYSWAAELINEHQMKNDEMKKRLIQTEESLRVSLIEAEEEHQKAEEKLQKAEETIAQLEVEKFKLKDQVETLRETVQDVEDLLTKARSWAAALMIEHQIKKHEMKKSLINTEESLKASLTEAEEKHQKAEETIAQLERRDKCLRQKAVEQKWIPSRINMMGYEV
ncbi:hypothetical protein AMELA_G00280730 [Ameiurus melas]|uniref:Uncharacterized protein n=1 Tax=Ameiurus melas TaxID=219545 RepID=A0A7J5ZMF7_AMEME|nr:hypothetical protein AMELA_G00280730 [Ameiurus melas]